MKLRYQPGELPDGLECSIASTDEDREQVYRLRYACYLRHGSIEPRPDRQFHDDFDTMPNQFSFLLREQGQDPLATVRISVVRPEAGWSDSPACRVFGDHAAFDVLRRGSFVEANRLCFANEAKRDLLMRLLGNVAALADYYKCAWLVACPRVEYTPLYRRVFGFQPLAEARQYFGVSFKTQLLGIRRDELRTRISGARCLRNAWLNAMVYLSRVQPGRSAGRA